MFMRTRIVALSLPLHIVMITYQYILMSSIAYAGSTTTKTARKTLAIVARLLIEVEEPEAGELIRFLSQNKARNLTIRNIFFTIDWTVVLAVNLSSVFIVSS